MPLAAIGLDADDTLWHNESVFAVTHQRFHDLLAEWLPAEATEARLLETERRNLTLFGYGVKGFVLSMIETAVEVSGGEVPASAVARIIDWGKEMLAHPVELLHGVRHAVAELAGDHRLVLITKGDLFHQESKVAESGLADLLWRVEVVGEKDTATYQRILARHDLAPTHFAMVGNSVRSDIVPVLELGGWGVHVPYELTWAIEHAELPADRQRIQVAPRFADVPAAISAIEALLDC